MEITKEEFSNHVERYKKGMRLTYMDAILFLCEKYNIEPEDAPKLLTKSLKQNIQKEAKTLKLLRK